MKREYPDRPFVGVGAVIAYRAATGGRVVLVRRASEPLRGEWSVPGGVVEVGETLRQAAIREAAEETGLIVEPGEVLEVFDSIVPDPAGKTQFHYVLVDLLCRPDRGELLAGSDVLEARWVEEKDLGKYPLSDSILAVVRKAFERLR